MIDLKFVEIKNNKNLNRNFPLILLRMNSKLCLYFLYLIRLKTNFYQEDQYRKLKKIITKNYKILK